MRLVLQGRETFGHDLSQRQSLSAADGLKRALDRETDRRESTPSFKTAVDEIEHAFRNGKLPVFGAKRSGTAASVFDELERIAFNSADDRARLAAINVILDRGWGKPAQALEGDGAGGPINVRIVQFGDVEAEEPKVA